jgi:DNA-binding response OmpR family regulator
MEDLTDVSTLLVDSLKNAGYEVVAAHDQPAWLETANIQPALIVVNLQMPQNGGQQLRYELRGQAEVPLLVLTASAHENGDRFSSRVRAILQRDSRRETLTFGSLVLDCDSHIIKVKDQPVMLTPREFALLEVLIREPGRTFSRNELLELCWGNGYNGVERVVDVHVVSLRRKLGKDHFIATVRGVGYRLRDIRESKHPTPT